MAAPVLWEYWKLLGSFDLIFYLPVDWDNYVRRHLIEEIARQLDGRSKVLCLERPVDLLVTSIKDRRKLWQWLCSLRNGIKRVRNLGDNLYLATPFVLVHDQLAFRAPGMVCLNRGTLSVQIRRLTRSLGLREQHLISWVFEPHQADYLGVAGERHLIYECYDEYLDPGNYGRKSDLRRMCEREMLILRQADLVFATSEDLARRRASANRKTYLVPNGADYDHFSRASIEATTLPIDVSGIKHPIIGFVGTMNESIDFPLLTLIAKRRPEWSIVLIGPFVSCGPCFTRSQEIKEARSCKNIHFLGPRPYAKIPDYLKSFDVCVVPYKNTKFNQNRSPVKLYEYLAAGKPVIATASLQAQLLGRLVVNPQGADGFIDAVDGLLRRDPYELAAEAQEFARENSWSQRARTILSIIRTLHA